MVGDIGGTNARFGIGGHPKDGLKWVNTYKTGDYPNILEAISDFLKDGRGGITEACLGVASPILGDRVKLTHSHWEFSLGDLKEQLGLQRLLVINDYEAMARSLPYLSPDEVLEIGPSRQRDQEKPMAILGPGTGLGMAALIPHQGGFVPLVTEGGHASLSATSPREWQIMEIIRSQKGHVCQEDLVSGQGLSNLYGALAQAEGLDEAFLKAEDVCQKAYETNCPVALEALDMFWGLLGSIAGDFALTTGALGGVYISGGIVPRYQEQWQQSCFRDRFLAKGSYKFYMEKIPTYLVVAEQPALRGALGALEEAGGV